MVDVNRYAGVRGAVEQLATASRGLALEDIDHYIEHTEHALSAGGFLLEQLGEPEDIIRNRLKLARGVRVLREIVQAVTNDAPTPTEALA